MGDTNIAIYFQDLHQHTARAHRNKCGVWQKNEDSKIQLSGYNYLEPLGPEGEGNE